MINIEVNLFAIYGVLAGEKVLTISAEQPLTVRTAVEQIVRKHSGLKPYWINNKHELQPQVHVFLNSEEVTLLPNGLDTLLADGDSLEFIPPIAGG
jgi:molybdopterin converting factor small subunit